MKVAATVAAEAETNRANTSAAPKSNQALQYITSACRKHSIKYAHGPMVPIDWNFARRLMGLVKQRRRRDHFNNIASFRR